MIPVLPNTAIQYTTGNIERARPHCRTASIPVTMKKEPRRMANPLRASTKGISQTIVSQKLLPKRNQEESHTIIIIFIVIIIVAMCNREEKRKNE